MSHPSDPANDSATENDRPTPVPPISDTGTTTDSSVMRAQAPTISNEGDDTEEIEEDDTPNFTLGESHTPPPAAMRNPTPTHNVAPVPPASPSTVVALAEVEATSNREMAARAPRTSVQGTPADAGANTPPSSPRVATSLPGPAPQAAVPPRPDPRTPRTLVDRLRLDFTEVQLAETLNTGNPRFSTDLLWGCLEELKLREVQATAMDHAPLRSARINVVNELAWRGAITKHNETKVRDDDLQHLLANFPVLLANAGNDERREQLERSFEAAQAINAYGRHVAERVSNAGPTPMPAPIPAMPEPATAVMPAAAPVMPVLPPPPAPVTTTPMPATPPVDAPPAPPPLPAPAMAAAPFVPTTPMTAQQPVATPHIRTAAPQPPIADDDDEDPRALRVRAQRTATGIWRSGSFIMFIMFSVFLLGGTIIAVRQSPATPQGTALPVYLQATAPVPLGNGCLYFPNAAPRNGWMCGTSRGSDQNGTTMCQCEQQTR